MTSIALRDLARVHAALAWAALVAAAAALVATLARRPVSPRVSGAAAALCAAAFASGATLHLPFQSKLRQSLFLASMSLGWLFERKEHAAFGALALSGCALFALWGERAAGRAGDADVAAVLRRARVTALASALVFELFAVAVSILAARRVTF